MSVIYLDTSALVKLVVTEPESAALAMWLDERADLVLCTSAIGKVELLRAARRRSPQTLPPAMNLMAELAVMPLDPTILDLATTLEPTGMRTLDALHLATAASLGGDLSVLVGYDTRLIEGARVLGLSTASPGS